jgi:DNA-binding HxlR family transcriptional regulator
MRKQKLTEDGREPEARDAVVRSPTALAFQILGDRWTLKILKQLFTGAKRFDELLKGTNAARGTLSLRLTEMIGAGLIYKNPLHSIASGHEYRLTDKGLDLYPTALLFWKWERTWGQGREILPARLIHSSCGQPSEPVFKCPACDTEVKAIDCNFKLNATPRSHPKTLNSIENRRRSSVSAQGKNPSGFHSINILGDKWSGLILGAIWFRFRRYDEILQALGISTNILANRLRFLTEQGVVDRDTSITNSSRPFYKLTVKGKDLYGITMLLDQWGRRWIEEATPTSIFVTHKCGAQLNPVIVCDTCNIILRHGEVARQND